MLPRSQDGLFAAINENDMNALRHLLQLGSDVKRRDGMNDTPLHVAVRLNRIIMVRALLKHGADLMGRNHHAETPLHVACKNGHDDMVKLLLKKKVDVNAKDHDQRTPLHHACESGYLDIVKLLLYYKANVKTKDRDGRTPMHLACKRVSEDNHYVTALLLLANGADPAAPDCDRRTPLHEACLGMTGTYVVQLFLADKSVVNYLDVNGRSALHYACEKGLEAVVKLLLTRGASVKIPPNNLETQETPLHAACRNGHIKVATLLLEAGAETDATSMAYQGQTPLHEACQSGHLDMVNFLLKNKANIEAVNHQGRTPLHDACLNGHRDVVDVLLENKADASSKDRDGLTLLHEVCLQDQGHHEIAEFLLENGADIKAVCHKGQTPLHLACLYNHSEIVKLLLKEKANVNALDHHKQTPLSLACLHGHGEVVRLLWDKGASITRFNSEHFNKLFAILADENFTQNSPIDLSKLALTDNGLINLANALNLSPQIINLTLSVNKFSHQGMHALAKALKTNKTLQTLDLSHNKIGSRPVVISGFQYLVTALYRNKSLVHLNLEGCSLDIDDIKSFLDYIGHRKYKTLAWVDFDDSVDAIVATLSAEEKHLFSIVKNAAAFHHVVHKVQQCLPVHEEEASQALERKLSGDNEKPVLSVKEHEIWLSHHITTCLHEYRSQFLSNQDNLTAKESHLNLLATLFMKCADLMSENNMFHLVPWMSNVQQIIDFARPSRFLDIIDTQDKDNPSSSCADEKDCTKIFHQSFGNQIEAFYKAASVVSSEHVDCATKTPTEKIAETLKNLISGLTGIGKLVEGAMGAAEVTGTVVKLILEGTEEISKGAKALNGLMESPIFNQGLDYFKDKVLRKIHGLTEQDKCRNLIKCFANGASASSKLKAITHAITHHYHEQLEKLTPVEAESWGKYAALHVAELLMSGVLSRIFEKTLTGIQLSEAVILWLSYAPMGNNALRIKKMMTGEEIQSAKNHFMQPKIKFYKNNKEGEKKIVTCSMMMKNDKGLSTTQNDHYPPRWATQKEVKALNKWWYGYEICLMSSLPSFGQPKPGNIYVEYDQEKDELCYIAGNPHGMPRGGQIKKSDFDSIGKDNYSLFVDALGHKEMDSIQSFLPGILAITSMKGHTPQNPQRRYDRYQQVEIGDAAGNHQFIVDQTEVLELMEDGVYFETELSDYSSHDKRLIELKELVEKLQEQVIRLKDMIEKQGVKINEPEKLKEKISGLEKNINGFAKRLSKLEESIKESTEQYRELKEKSNEQETRIDKLEKKDDVLEVTIEKHGGQLEKQREQISKLKRECDEIKKERDELQKKNSEYDEQINELRKESKKYQEQNSMLIKIVGKQEQKINYIVENMIASPSKKTTTPHYQSNLFSLFGTPAENEASTPGKGNENVTSNNSNVL